MDISTGLIAKAAAGTAAIAATTTTGVIYGEDIVGFFVGGERGDVGITANHQQSGEDSLSLPAACTLPTDDNTTKTCSLSADELKNINFANKSAENVNANDVSLTIEKTNDTTSFPEGYKFIFNTTTDNISSPISLKKNTNTEFKIKKNGDGIWSLERAWTIVEFVKKVGLNCDESKNTCDISTNFNVYVSADKKLSNVSITGGAKGKIKFEKEVGGYNQGFKFTIEEKSINFSNSNSSFKRLEKYETYEIKEQAEGSGKKWYFSRKNSAVSVKNNKLTGLGLPAGCVFEENSDEKDCGKLDEDKLKAINFDGKSENPTITGDLSSVTLKIRKDGGENLFTDGIRIIFENGSEAINSSELKIDWKSGTNPEYKIKNSGGPTIESAWVLDKLAKKVNITCTGKTPVECTFGEKINLFKDVDNNVIGATVPDYSSKKIKIEKDQEGYNQGFKFTVETLISDIQGGTQKKSSGSSITEIEKATYEIKEQTVNGQIHWFLSKKS